MKATIKELRRTLFDFDFDLMVNKERMNCSKGRETLFNIEDQDMEVDFHLGNTSVIVINSKI